MLTIYAKPAMMMIFQSRRKHDNGESARFRVDGQRRFENGKQSA